ncbi:glycosyltransferase family 2 protein [Cellulomonas carbonis]|uniref:glycosyltransferase family 2 protein n=1 Tax=Cellulomonas carbonis TaxID=1386092 RepID=UPI000A71B687|nr:glycosyltransferase [Cellulomonas carbonis]
MTHASATTGTTASAVPSSPDDEGGRCVGGTTGTAATTGGAGDDVPDTDAQPTARAAVAGEGSVTVAVLTYRRPEDLTAVLPQLLDQLPDALAEVLVVDNDPDASGRPTVLAVPDARVRYVHEPVPGIAAARNRALAESSADVLVFIDDDERPSPGWLDALLRVHAAEGSAAVVGPVVSEFEVEPEPWIRDGGFFERRRPPTGAVVEAAATNNLLLDMRVVRRLGLTFDERFGLTGGSDTLFTRRLTRAGERIVWCAEAPVVDVVPRQRLTRRWVLQKALRSGNSWSRTSLELADGPVERSGERVRLALRGAVRVGGGAARLVLGAVTRDRAHRARGARTLARGLGLASGAFGYVYVEYRRTAARATTSS